MTNEQFTFANAMFITSSYEKFEKWIEERVNERITQFDYIESVSVWEDADGVQKVSVEYRDRFGDWESESFTWDEILDRDAWLARREAEKAEAARQHAERKAELERKDYEKAVKLVQQYESNNK